MCDERNTCRMGDEMACRSLRHVARNSRIEPGQNMSDVNIDRPAPSKACESEKALPFIRGGIGDTHPCLCISGSFLEAL